jgi:hypothetical protein
MARAGSSIEDFCRACKTDRMHTVVATDGVGTPIRVRCGYCDSEHNYRGGPRVDVDTGVIAQSRTSPRVSSPRATPPHDAMPIVSERERTVPPVTLNDNATDLEMLLRRIIREESGLTSVTPAAKWRGGTMVLKPADSSLQEKTWPIETFFHKVVMLRNRLRTLEQQVNGSNLSEDEKIKLQTYITGCYGSLTSFNLLFADEADKFYGQGEG